MAKIIDMLSEEDKNKVLKILDEANRERNKGRVIACPHHCISKKEYGGWCEHWNPKHGYVDAWNEFYDTSKKD